MLTILQSKQYLQTHSVTDAHPSDIFSIAVTQKQLLSVSGSSSIQVYNLTFSPDEPTPYPHAQTLENAHSIGAHHLCVSANGKVAASAGFGGDVNVWTCDDQGIWKSFGQIKGKNCHPSWCQSVSLIAIDDTRAGEIWAIALSEDGQFLAGTTYDGRVNVWDSSTIGQGDKADAEKIRQYETKGSYGMSIDLVRNIGRVTWTTC